jgi:hypothetical protein
MSKIFPTINEAIMFAETEWEWDVEPEELKIEDNQGEERFFANLTDLKGHIEEKWNSWVENGIPTHYVREVDHHYRMVLPDTKELKDGDCIVVTENHGLLKEHWAVYASNVDKVYFAVPHGERIAGYRQEVKFLYE